MDSAINDQNDQNHDVEFQDGNEIPEMENNATGPKDMQQKLINIINNFADMGKHLFNFEEQIKNFDKEIHDLEEKISSEHELSRVLDNDLNVIKVRNENLEETLNDLESTNRVLQIECEEHKRKIKEILERRAKERSEYKEKLNTLLGYAAENTEEYTKDNLLKNIAQIQTEYESVGTELEEAEAKLNALIDNYGIAIEENKGTEENLLKLLNEQKRIASGNRNLRIDSLIASTSELSGEIEDLENYLKDAKNVKKY